MAGAVREDGEDGRDGAEELGLERGKHGGEAVEDSAVHVEELPFATRPSEELSREWVEEERAWRVEEYQCSTSENTEGLRSLRTPML